MKGLAIYFSGTGNTKFAVQLFSSEFENAGCEVEMHSTEENFKIVQDTYDFLILGCPKYCEYPVISFINYIKKNLPASKKQIKTIMFCTQTGPLGTDFNKIRKILKKKNHELVISRSLIVANNFLVMKSFKGTTEETMVKNEKVLRSQIHELTQKFLSDKCDNESINPFLGALDKSVAVLCDKLLPKFAMKYSASSSCVKCGLCIKMCPKKNIQLKDNHIEFGKQCMFCMRCINICPKNAILYDNRNIPQYRKHINLIK